MLLLFGDNGIFKTSENAKEQTNKQTAIEIMKLKIADIQMNNYVKTSEFPSLQILSDNLCEDNDIEYVEISSKRIASIDKINIGNATSIFTKLKDYPYEFEINSKLQIATIDGNIIDNTNNNNNIDISVNDNHLLYLYNNMLRKVNTIELLINDTALFTLVLSIKDNVDYIIDNPNVFLDKILNSETAVKALANNDYAKNRIRQNSTWFSALKKCEYAYTTWSQPILSSDITNIKDGTITLTSSHPGGSNNWGALDGKKSNGEGGYWWPGASAYPAWWQVEFPYEIRIKSIDYYAQYSTDQKNIPVTARLYTDSTKTTPIGNEFSANYAWEKVSISGINENEIITNTIYFYKTVGGGGIGELVINADKFIF